MIYLKTKATAEFISARFWQSQNGSYVGKKLESDYLANIIWQFYPAAKFGSKYFAVFERLAEKIRGKSNE